MDSQHPRAATKFLVFAQRSQSRSITRNPPKEQAKHNASATKKAGRVRVSPRRWVTIRSQNQRMETS